MGQISYKWQFGSEITQGVLNHVKDQGIRSNMDVETIW